MPTADQALTEFENNLGPRLFNVAIKRSPPLLLGRRYELEKILGRGARGLVVRARDVKLNRPVALKIYPDFDPTLIAEAQAEAQCLAQLNHPNIVVIKACRRAKADFATLESLCQHGSQKAKTAARNLFLKKL